MFNLFRRRVSSNPWTPPHSGTPSFTDLTEQLPSSELPPLDRPDVDHDSLTQDQRDWIRDGVVIKRKFFPDSVIDPYIAVRQRLSKNDNNFYHLGWSSPAPYLNVPELADLSLYPPLMTLMKDLVGEEMMLHLNLTGWISTERNWHQDDYLNPGHVKSWYAAIWVALGHVHEGCGPFQYIKGSHRWPLLRQAKVKSWMSPAELAERADSGVETWEKQSEKFVVPAIEGEIRSREAQISHFIAEKGDLLIWHGRLMHRGSRAVGPDIIRPAVIAHYSGINHRPDMPQRATSADGQWYAVFKEWMDKPAGLG